MMFLGGNVGISWCERESVVHVCGGFVEKEVAKMLCMYAMGSWRKKRKTSRVDPGTAEFNVLSQQHVIY